MFFVMLPNYKCGNEEERGRRNQKRMRSEKRKEKDRQYNWGMGGS